jgi:hypothetical protein
MSELDKFDLLNERHSDFEKALDADAQKLLARYDEIDAKKQKVLERRLLALSERGKKLDEIQAVLDRVTSRNFDEIDAVFDRMTNLGSSPSSKALPKAMRIRLKEPCFLNNHRYEGGEIVTLPDGVRGPHRTVRQVSNHIAWTIDRPADAVHRLAEICDALLRERYHRIPMQRARGPRNSVKDRNCSVDVGAVQS